ncbi:MAG: tRNA pseudouridine(38-40) synthase TruA, partial [Lachnospiraceae bacterium]|nr:tRNA pseudouridine(38-40) synthase TruA [Lachnospiraceae bacterium]
CPEGPLLMRVMLVVAYDGTAYAGSQIQANALTIEAVLLQELEKVLHENNIKLLGASRTDSGVHALGNVWVFDTQTTIPAEKISYALNRSLPPDIVVQASREARPDFHPRYTKTSKTYLYRILNRTFPDPLRSRYTHCVYGDLDTAAMQEAADFLVGEHDFTSFASIHSQTDSFVRTIYRIRVFRTGMSVDGSRGRRLEAYSDNGFVNSAAPFQTDGADAESGDEVDIEVTGNGFLYNMVRIIAGTLINVGLGRTAAAEIPAILEKKDREAAGPTAPAKGLTLVKIEYPEL